MGNTERNWNLKNINMKNITKILLTLFVFINSIALYRMGIDNLITFYEHFLIALFGAAAWCFGLFRFEKNKHDKEGTKLNFDKYKEDNWDDWAWTFMFSFPIVKYSADLFDIVNKFYDLPIYEAYYLCAGPLSVAVGYGMNWVIKKFA